MIAKRLLSLGAALVFGAAWADTWTDTNGIIWTYTVDSEKNATITDAMMPDESRLSGEIVVPKTFGEGENACTVTTIERGKGVAFNGSAVTKVTLPDTLTTLNGGSGSAGAFANCASLKEVYGPGVINAEYNAFKECTELLHVELYQGSDKTVFLGKSCFHTCSKLTNIVVNTSKLSFEAGGYYAFYKCKALETYLDLPQITSVKDNMFAEATLKNLNLPNLISIEAGAFSKMTILENLVLGRSLMTVTESAVRYADFGLSGDLVFTNLTSLAKYAMESCDGITSVFIDYSPRELSLGYAAFRYNDDLTNAVILCRTTIDEDLFYACPKLQKVKMPLLRTSAGDFLNGTAITNGVDDLHLPQLTTLADLTLTGSKLVTFKLPYGVHTLGNPDKVIPTVYYHVGTSLTTDEIQTAFGATTLIPYGGTSTEQGATWYYDTRKDATGEAIVLGAPTATGDVVMPDKFDGKTITAIEAGAFMDATTMTSFAVAKKVNSIGVAAFPAGCKILVHPRMEEKYPQLLANLRAEYGADNIKFLPEDGFRLIVR